MKKINWRYAIGELLIVTAGITLAFMLNSWAENNRIKEKRQIYLEGIVQDLEADKALLDSTILESQMRLNVLYGLMPYLNGKTVGRDSVFFGFFRVIDPVRVNPHSSTIQTLQLSGDLNLIDDMQLKNRLVEHYDQYNDLEMEFKRHETFSKQFMASYLMENMDYSQMRYKPDLSFVDDVYFKNLVFSLIGIYGLSIEKQELARIRVEELIPRVKKTIK